MWQNYFKAFLFQSYKLWVQAVWVYYKNYYSTLLRSSIGKILHSTWRNTSLQDATFYLEKYFSARCFILLGELHTLLLEYLQVILHGELHLYRSFLSKEPYSLQSILQGLLPVLTHSTNKNFLLGESTCILQGELHSNLLLDWNKNSTRGNTSNGTIQVLVYIEWQTFFNSPAELQSSRL